MTGGERLSTPSCQGDSFKGYPVIFYFTRGATQDCAQHNFFHKTSREFPQLVSGFKSSGSIHVSRVCWGGPDLVERLANKRQYGKTMADQCFGSEGRESDVPVRVFNWGQPVMLRS